MPAPLSNRPLYDTAADARYFLPHDGWQSLFRWAHQGYNTLLTGPTGSGKTTTLRQLQRRLREDGTRVSFVDATLTEGVGHLIALIGDALVGQPGAADLLAKRFDRLRHAVAGAPPGTITTALHEIVEGWGEADPQVVLLDAGGGGEAVYDLFGRLRDELWQLELIWVVAVTDADAATVLRPPADAFFDQRLRLDQWPTERLQELLETRGVSHADAARIAPAGEGNPRRALTAAREVSSSGFDRHLAQRARLDAAGALSESHREAQLAVEELGAVSASDAELLRRLAMSRPRVQTLLADLTERGLLVADSAQPTGRGRPRKLFRPAAGS